MWPWFHCKFLPPNNTTAIGQIQPCGNSKQLSSRKSQNRNCLKAWQRQSINPAIVQFPTTHLNSAWEKPIFSEWKGFYPWSTYLNIRESEYAASPPLHPRHWLRSSPLIPPVFRFGCRLLLLSSQQALKASPFTTGIINIICRYGNLHFSNLSLGAFCMQSNSKSDQKVWETIQN